MKSDDDCCAPFFNKREVLAFRHGTVLVVLNDGETYTSVEGVKLVFMDKDSFDDEDVKAAFRSGRLITDMMDVLWNR